MTALIGYIFYRWRRGHTRSTGNSKDDDTIDLRLREPRAPEGHSPKTESHPVMLPPPLKPRLKYENYEFTGLYAAEGSSYSPSPTSPSLSIGPYAAMRSPEMGIAYVPTSPYKAEWTSDNSLRPPHGVSINSSKMVFMATRTVNNTNLH